MTPEPKLKPKKKKVNPLVTLGWFVLIAFGIVSGLAWVYYLFVSKIRLGYYQNEGLFGDSFGAFNAIIQGVTFAGVVYTILQQHIATEHERKLERWRWFESNFMELVQLHIRSFDEIEKYGRLFSDFESFRISRNLSSFSTIEEKRHEYRTVVEVDVVKNFANHLRMFQYIISRIQSKDTLETRSKYYTIYFSQMHINEKRFLLYEYVIGSLARPKDPAMWKELHQHLFQDFYTDYIHDSFFQNEIKTKYYTFDGILSRENDLPTDQLLKRV